MFRLLIAMALAACAATTFAQHYPSRPIRFVALNPPGSVTDTLARIVGERLAERLGQPVIIDNRVGGGGVMGTEIVATSPPDGYTLLMGFIGNLAIQPALHAKLPYDVIRDFAPVSLTGRSPQIMVINPQIGVRTVQEYVTLAKAKPGQLLFASSGNGNNNHLVGELFMRKAGINIVHVPYKGGPPAMTAVMSNEVSMMFSNPPPALPQIRAGRIRALAVTTGERIESLPDVPTLQEAGFKDFLATSWFGVVVAAKTPAAIVTKLNGEIVQVLKEREVRERIIVQGLIPESSTPQAFGELIRTELALWTGVIRQARIVVD
jgi:tripartite-type tricarboxylate transporter receptor subunit TctC